MNKLIDRLITRPLERLIITCQSKDASEEHVWCTWNCTSIVVHCGGFARIPDFDAIAMAGTSFGLLDAGMDLAILRFFGPHAPKTKHPATLTGGRA